MIFEYTGYRRSRVENEAAKTTIHFSPEASRGPVFFSGELGQPWYFREALYAFYETAVCNVHTRIDANTSYRGWLEAWEPVMLAEFMAEDAAGQKKVRELATELADLRKAKKKAMGQFDRARRSYENFLYGEYVDDYILPNPWASVYPDRIIFECLSLDASIYTCLSLAQDAFDHLGESVYGTTSIDFSLGLGDGFQKIRTYETCQLVIETDRTTRNDSLESVFFSRRIDISENWLRSFLQLTSAMNLPAYTVQLHPMDIHNLCFLLQRGSKKTGSDSIRFLFRPGEPLRIVLDANDKEIVCRFSVFYGSQPGEVRIWGGSRLRALERLIPVSDRFTVHLLGTGLPSYWIAEMPRLKFILGIPGTLPGDWSRAGQSDLLAPRLTAAPEEKARVVEILTGRWSATTEELAQATGLSRGAIFGIMTSLAQEGCAFYDLGSSLYRWRKLFSTDLPVHQLRFADQREAEADRLLAGQTITVYHQMLAGGARQLSASMVDHDSRRFDVSAVIDTDERLTEGQCQCVFFKRNRLRRGPCAHMLALRLAQSAGSRASGSKHQVEEGGPH